MRKYQFHDKREYAERTYNRKRQFYGKEKPEIYELLKKHYRRAIAEAIEQIPNHKTKLHEDKYFIVTYDTKTKIFEILSRRSAKVHKNKNHRERLEDIASKRTYLTNRLKFWDTQRLLSMGEKLLDFSRKVQQLELEYEKQSIATVEDVIAEILFNVSFKPVGTPVNGSHRKDKSLEVKKADLAHYSRIDEGGVSLESFTESLLRDSAHNRLAEVGYAVGDNEYGYGGSVEQHYNLADEIRTFIQNYSSSSAYFAQKKAALRQINNELYTASQEILDAYGMYADKRNVRLLMVVIDEILEERNPDAYKKFCMLNAENKNPSYETDDFGGEDMPWNRKGPLPHNGDIELPF